jgi:hypothetical protein
MQSIPQLHIKKKSGTARIHVVLLNRAAPLAGKNSSAILSRIFVQTVVYSRRW